MNRIRSEDLHLEEAIGLPGKGRPTHFSFGDVLALATRLVECQYPIVQPDSEDDVVLPKPWLLTIATPKGEAA